MAEKRTIELEIQDNSKTLKQQYKEAVVELQKVAAAYGETSQQAAEAAKKAAGLKDRIEDTNDAIKAFKGEGAFNALGKSVSSVASGFSAVEGAMGLVGVESEKLQETMLRVQSAMALAQGLEGLEDAGRAFKQLGTVAINALKGIRGALAATGIGLFVVALGTVVAYWDDIKAAISGVSEEQANLNKLSHANFETAKEELSTLDAQDNILKLQGKSEREILNLKIAKINMAIELGKIELENIIRTSKAEEEAAIKNYNLTKSIVNLIIDTALFLPKLMIQPIDLAIQGVNKISEGLGLGKLISFDLGKTIEGLEDKASGFVAGSLFNVEDVKAEGEKTRKGIEKELKDLENQKAGFQLSIKAIDKQAVQDSKKNQEDALSEEERKQKEHQEKYLNEDRLRTKSVLDASNQRMLQEQSETEFQRQQNEIRVQSNQEYLAKIAAQEAEDAARKKRNRDFAVEMAISGFNTIASLTDLFGKKSEKAARIAFRINKGAQIASATMSTYQSATQAYASQLIPGDPSSPIRGAIAAGAAVFAGLANVAKIASQKFEGGGSSGGGGGAASAAAGGGAQMAAPQFQTIGTSGINQLATLQQQPTQAYVVSGHVTSAQALDRNRVQNATL
jgi:PAS domain-containing protein